MSVPNLHWDVSISASWHRLAPGEFFCLNVAPPPWYKLDAPGRYVVHARCFTVLLPDEFDLKPATSPLWWWLEHPGWYEFHNHPQDIDTQMSFELR